MADLNELFKKASNKKSVPLSPTKRSFGLKETMASIKSDPTINKGEPAVEETLGSREAGVSQTLGQTSDVRQALGRREIAVSQTLGDGDSTSVPEKFDQSSSNTGSKEIPKVEKVAEIIITEVKSPTTPLPNDSIKGATLSTNNIHPKVNGNKENGAQALGSREADVSQTLGDHSGVRQPLGERNHPRDNIIAPQITITKELPPSNPEPTKTDLKTGSPKEQNNHGPLQPQQSFDFHQGTQPTSSKPTSTQSQTLGRRELGVSQTLGESKTDVRQPLVTPRDAVSQTLVKNKALEMPLGKPLARRELDVSQSLGEPLASREADVRSLEQFKRLVGNERELTEIVFIETRKTGTLSTDAIRSEDLCTYFNMNSNSLRNLVDRLKKKEIVTCSSSVGGHTSVRFFTLTLGVYQHLMNQTLGGRELAVRWTLGRTLGSREADVSQTLVLPPRKEGSIINKYLTNLGEESQASTEAIQTPMFNTTEIITEHTQALMEDFNYWPKYFSDLKRNLISKNKTLTTEDLQNLVDRLPEYVEFSLKTGQPIKRVGAFFIKEAMNFAETGDCTLSLFKTKAEVQREEMIKQLKQKALDEQKKMAEELDLIKQGAFHNWVESMSEDQQKALAAPMNNSKMLIMSSLRARFETDVWEHKKRELGLI